jgi:hypothetical protein
MEREEIAWSGQWVVGEWRLRQMEYVHNTLRCERWSLKMTSRSLVWMYIVTQREVLRGRIGERIRDRGSGG